MSQASRNGLRHGSFWSCSRLYNSEREIRRSASLSKCPNIHLTSVRQPAGKCPLCIDRDKIDRYNRFAVTAPPRRRAAAPPRRRARSSQLHICNNRTFGLDALTTVFSVCHNDGKPIEQSVSHCRSWRGWTVGDTRRRLGTRDGLEGRWIILLDLVAHRVLVVVFARSAASLFVIKLNN